MVQNSFQSAQLLLMAEILHQLRLVVYPIIYRVSYIAGGAGFQPSTVATFSNRIANKTYFENGHQVRCKVVGGTVTFGTGRRAVLRPVPLLSLWQTGVLVGLGCW